MGEYIRLRRLTLAGAELASGKVKVMSFRTFEEFRSRVVNEWLPGSGYELDDRPEVIRNHWFYRYGDEAYNSSRYEELWLPIVKRL